MAQPARAPSQRLLLDTNVVVGALLWRGPPWRLLEQALEDGAELFSSPVRVVPGDADDDHVIAAALAGQVDAIISGDKHLLTIGSHEGIAIVGVQEGLVRLVQR